MKGEMMELEERIVLLLEDGSKMKIHAGAKGCAFEIDGPPKPGSTPVLGMFALDWDRVWRLQKILKHLFQGRKAIIEIDQGRLKKT